ncbi:phosphoglycolate phosphatase [Rhabdaerophilum sp. SD176]|uniref:phosphoglycolate phosphatase n=1 Tax=Rhabdaerophilum sp. SD176 TaxID=2983548 RepID=UPI0024E0395B|nr:phosphoglycolate phosphatase [Rhabdaerophilum sp. SD176]
MRGTVVFDLDGTLAETAPDIMATLNVLLEAEDLAALPVSAARNLVGAGARALIERGFRVSGVPLSPERLDRLFEAFLVHYLDHVADHSYLFPGVEAALTALAGEGHLLAVCTNKPERHSRALIEQLGVFDRFAAIAGRDTFAFCKPDPRHLTETIRLAGGDIGRAVMVGDSRTDIDTARAAGLPVVAVTFGYTDTPVEQLGPDVVINHFDALPAEIARWMP